MQAGNKSISEADHDEDEHEEHAGHDEHHDKEEHHHHHGGKDPHIWLDLENDGLWLIQ
jgi:ABC-type Zn2+ transport system substrate-binding protein/surface adhesin